MPSYALALPQVGVGAERRHHRRALRVRDGEDLTPPAVVEGAFGSGAVRGRGAFFFAHNTYERPVLEVDFSCVLLLSM